MQLRSRTPAFLTSANSALTSWRVSVRRPWRLRSTLYRTQKPVPAASQSPPMTRSITQTMHEATWATLTQQLGNSKEWPSPGGSGSNPYGIAITRDAVVWYSESGVHPNTLVRFAPKAKTFSSTPIPSGGGVVRNMAATKDGRLYLACSGVDKVAWRLLKYGD